MDEQREHEDERTGEVADAQLEQATGSLSLNFTKLEYKSVPYDSGGGSDDILVGGTTSYDPR